MAYLDFNSDALFAGMYDEPAGTVVRNIPRALVTNQTLAMNGTGNAIGRAIALPAGLVVNKIMLLTGTTAASSPTHFWVGLTDIQLNVLGVSADQGSGAIGASTFFNLALTVPVQITQTGLYYVVVSVSATVTMPNLSGAVNTATGNAAKAPILGGTISSQATPPSVGTQLNSGTITGNDAFNFAAWIS